MRNLNEELEANFVSFNSELKNRFNNSFDTLQGNNNLYVESYKRLSSLEAWRAYVLENKISSSSLSFFLEAQNDALLSHTLAKIGSWRSALQCLRSVIENTLFCLYYKDHPVEYELWEAGKYQLPISDYIKYISKHPKFSSLNDILSGVALLKKEYSTLSKAVHASSVSFRMTQIEQHFPAIMLPDLPKLNQWLTREEKTIQVINQILIAMYFDDLEGAKLRNLRKSISFTIPNNLHEQIRSQFNIRLFELAIEN